MSIKITGVFLSLLILSGVRAVGVLAQDASRSSSVTNSQSVSRALEYLKSIEQETVEEQIKITQIPAPTFKESQRAEYLKKRFSELGLQNVRLDRAGNVIGEKPGAMPGTTLVVAAHLDTVFDEKTDVSVKREGPVLKAPGIGDDSRGLAVMLALVRALNREHIETKGNIIFVANVAEEGLGDLRGTRHLFEEELKGKITHFISIDSPGLEIVNRAVGSLRYRVTFRGSGGHSYLDFGLPNPVHALGRAIEKISRFKTPERPKTTFSVGRVDGGTSVNSIAHTAWMEVDLRSEGAPELAELDARLKRTVQQALDEENAFWGSEKKLTVEVKPIGNRPTGAQSADAPIVKAALEADVSLGIKSSLEASSTDANIPISLGIPAITIGGGGKGSGLHSLNETFDTTDSHLGTQRALLVILNVVGLK